MIHIRWFVVALLIMFVASFLAIKNTYGAERAKDIEIFCLTEALYFEARGESPEGQFAVALVILNRQWDSRFPSTVCGVVRQYKQFSYFSDGKPETVTDKRAWKLAKHIANSVYTHYVDHLRCTLHDITHGALYYFNPALANPIWAEGMILTRTVGNHVFLKPVERVRIYL